MSGARRILCVDEGGSPLILKLSQTVLRKAKLPFDICYDVETAIETILSDVGARWFIVAGYGRTQIPCRFAEDATRLQYPAEHLIHFLNQHNGLINARVVVWLHKDARTDEVRVSLGDSVTRIENSSDYPRHLRYAFRQYMGIEGEEESDE